MVRGLTAANETEEARRQEWLGQIDSFTTQDIINFRLYMEFSNPTLADTTVPQGTLEELDAYTERQGWLEFRFGKSLLQEGYYDNESVSELRIAPCEPSEALRRRAIVMERVKELASEYNRLLVTSAQSEHPNLSMYTTNADGEQRSVIGQDVARRERTLDVAAGIVAAYQDGLFLNAADMKWDYLFDAKYGGEEMSLGPTRESVRILDDRVELRAKFRDTEQGVLYTMAGMVYGVQRGSHVPLQI